jgi:hypothetical protein
MSWTQTLSIKRKIMKKILSHYERERTQTFLSAFINEIEQKRPNHEQTRFRDDQNI